MSSYVQVHNQKSFRVGKFSSNQGTLINNHVQKEKEKSCGKKSPASSPGNS